MKHACLIAVTALVLFLAPASHAQELRVNNVRVEQQDEFYILRYNLLWTGSQTDKFKVKARFLRDDYKLKKATGDIDRNVFPGPNKTITWEVQKEKRYQTEGLTGENLRFEIVAKKQGPCGPTCRVLGTLGTIGLGVVICLILCPSDGIADPPLRPQ